jgi:two-component system sensor histidine kinase/response regulator
MREPPQPPPFAGTRPRRALLGVALAVLAVVANSLAPPLLAPGVPAFSTLFAFLALVWLGIVPALLLALVGSAVGVFVYGQGWPAAVPLLEVAAVAVLRGRVGWSAGLPLAVLDSLYWLFLGLPLLALAPEVSAPPPGPQVLQLAVQQALLGVLNAIGAGVVIFAVDLCCPRAGGLSLRRAIFNLLLGALYLPTLVFLLLAAPLQGERQVSGVPEAADAALAPVPLEVLLALFAVAVAGTGLSYLFTGWVTRSLTGLVGALKDYPARVSRGVPPIAVADSPITELAELQVVAAEMALALGQRNREAAESRRQLEGLIGNLPGIAFRCRNDAHWTMEWLSREVETITGYAPDDLLENRTLSFASLIEPEDEDRVWIEVQRALDAGERYDIEYRIRDRAGRVRWLMERGSALSDADGAPVAVEGFITEITRRKEIELALRDSEASFRLAAEVGHFGSWVLDLENNHLTWSDEVYRIFGLEPQALEATYERFLSYVHPEDRERVNDAYQGSVSAGRSRYELRHRIVRADRGEVREVLERCEHQRSEAGVIVASVGTVMDITELVAAQRELERYREHLEELVQSRTAELEVARRQAEAANLAKSAFLANMSHEIRTPMNTIIGMTHLTLDSELDARQRHYLEQVEASGQLLLRLINDILDLSKIEAGKVELERIDFDLEQLLGNALATVADGARDKGLELVLRLDPAVPRQLRGDPTRLSQVLLNYLSNAVKFTRRGEITVRVGLEAADDETVQLRLEVADTGIGISEAQQAQLFQRFQQADPSSTREFGGTGLGLSVARELVELMGGAVGVTSEPGVGSTFWATVRLERSATEARHLLPEPDLRGLRVLLLEDNATSRAALADMLRAMSFEVTAVADRLQAVDACQAALDGGAPFRVALIGWRPTQPDGIAIARALRDAFGSGAPPALLVTAGDDAAARRRAAEAGIAPVLTKPVTPSALFDGLMERLRGRGQAGPADQALPARSPAPALSTVAGARLLLVEDNPSNQELALELLRRAGFEVEVAENGAEAVERLREQGGTYYDLVLMDLQMPVMDGLEATRQIHALPGCGELPIIAMTANAMGEDRARCLAAGMCDHVAKPIDPALLWAALQRHLPPRQAPTAAAPALSKPRAGDTGGPVVLPDLEGVDRSLGLKRCLGEEALYLSVLRRFPTGQGEVVAALRDALAQADRLLAERLAHTLKSDAALIGAGELQQRAERLELALREGAAEECIEEQLVALAPLVRRLAAAIGEVLAPDDAASDDAVDPERARAVCDELRSLLVEGEIASKQLLHREEAMLRAALGDRFESLLRSVDDYEFDRALALLDDCAMPGAPAPD